jgi:acetoin utilization protein AcuA
MRTSTQTVPEATIHVARHPRDLEGLAPDPGLGAFFGYAVRAPERTLEGIRRALLHGGRAVLARRGPVVVGYLTLSRPDADQPWGRVPGLPVREITVEVARGWRRRGLARRLFGTLLALPDAEEAILVAAGYRWCWDLEDGHDPEAAGRYRRHLVRLFEDSGFSLEATNEPNIVMDPHNFLAVRVGSRVPPAQVDRFRATLFSTRAA